MQVSPNRFPFVLSLSITRDKLPSIHPTSLISLHALCPLNTHHPFVVAQLKMSNRILTSSEVDSGHPDLVRPSSASGAEESNNSLSFISDVQSAVARIEQRLAQSPSQSSTSFTSSFNPTASASSSTLVAVSASPVIPSFGTTISTPAHTSATTLVTEKVELFERSDRPAMPKPSLSRDVISTTPPPPPLSPSPSYTAQPHAQSQSTHGKISSSCPGISTSIEITSGNTSEQVSAPLLVPPSSIAAVIERFENVLEPKTQPQGQIRPDANPIAPTVEQFEVQVTTDKPRIESSHIIAAPVPSESRAMTVVQAEGAFIVEPSNQSETSESSNASMSTPLNPASSSVVPVIEKHEPQVGDSVPAIEQIHTVQTQLVTSVEQSELASIAKQVTLPTAGPLATPATPSLEKTDNRSESTVENDPAKLDMEVPSVALSVDMLEDQPRAKMPPVQTNLSSVPAVDIVETTTTTISQHNVPFVDFAPAQSISNIDDLVTKITTEPGKILVSPPDGSKDADAPMDPPSDTEQPEMEYDTPVPPPRDLETFAELQNSASYVKIESDTVVDQAQSVGGDKRLQNFSATIATQNNKQVAFSSPVEGENTASNTPWGLQNEGEQLGKANENMDATHLNQGNQDFCSDRLLDQTSKVLKGYSTLVEATGSDEAEVTLSTNEREYGRSFNVPPGHDPWERANFSSKINTHAIEHGETEAIHASGQSRKAGPLSTMPAVEQRPHFCELPTADSTTLRCKFSEGRRCDSPQEPDVSETSDAVIVDTCDEKEVDDFIGIVRESTNLFADDGVVSEVRNDTNSRSHLRFTDVLEEAERLVAAGLKNDFKLLEAKLTNYSESKTPNLVGVPVNNITPEAGLSLEEGHFLAALSAEIARQEMVEDVPDATGIAALAERGTQCMRLTTEKNVGRDAGRSAGSNTTSTGKEDVIKQRMTQGSACIFSGSETIVESSVKTLPDSPVAQASAEESPSTEQDVFQGQKTPSGSTKEYKPATVTSPKIESVATSALTNKVISSDITEASQVTTSRDTVQDTTENKGSVCIKTQLSAPSIGNTRSNMVAAGSILTFPKQEGFKVRTSHQTTIDNESATDTTRSASGSQTSEDDASLQSSTPVRQKLEATGSPVTPDMEENRRITTGRKQTTIDADSCHSLPRGQVSWSLVRQAEPSTVSTNLVQSPRASRPGSSSFGRQIRTPVSPITITHSRMLMNNHRARKSRPDGSPLPSGGESTCSVGSAGQVRGTINLFPNKQSPIIDQASPRLPRFVELSEHEGMEKKVLPSKPPRGSTFAGTVPRTRTAHNSRNLRHNLSSDMSASSTTPPVRPLSPNLSSASVPVGDDKPTTNNRMLRRTLSFSHSRRMTTPSSNISQSPAPHAPFGSNSGRTRLMDALSSPRANGLERRATMSMTAVSAPRPSRSFPRHRPTVPRPFDLVGLALHERAQQTIEEARRRADENERRRRSFKARPMPDFSNPSPKPKK